MSCAAHPLVKSAWNGQTTVRDHGAIERWRPASQIMRGWMEMAAWPRVCWRRVFRSCHRKERAQSAVRVALDR